MARNFSKYAKHYDLHCYMQNICASQLIDSVKSNDFSRILEIGCGTGNYTQMLREKFPASCIKALDISQDMIEIARAKLDHAQVKFIVADAESIDLDGKFDFISSNATFQWFQHLEHTLTQYHHLLSDDGIISFSVFGPLTFVELSECLKEVYGEDVSISSNGFADGFKITQMLHNVFGNGVIEQRIFREEHGSLLELLTRIKYTGTGGNGARTNSWWTPKSIQKLEDVYRLKYGRIVATYQVLLCQAVNGP